MSFVAFFFHRPSSFAGYDGVRTCFQSLLLSFFSWLMFHSRRSQQPADDNAEAAEMFLASDEDADFPQLERAGDHDAQGHDGGPVEIQDDQHDQDDDEDPSVDAADLPQWPNYMELGVSCLEPWHCPKTVGRTRNHKDLVKVLSFKLQR